MTAAAIDVESANLRHILELSVPVSVTLAERDMSIEELLDLAVGTIIEFETSAFADLVLCVAGVPIARGQTVKVGEKFGLQLTSIDAVRDRITAMGGK